MASDSIDYLAASKAQDSLNARFSEAQKAEIAAAVHCLQDAGFYFVSALIARAKALADQGYDHSAAHDAGTALFLWELTDALQDDSVAPVILPGENAVDVKSTQKMLSGHDVQLPKF